MERFSFLEGFVPFDSRKEAYNQLLEALKDGNHYKIGLHGMLGSGKSTLAIEVGKEVMRLNLFDYVFMVNASNNGLNIVQKIQEQIASHLNLEWDRKNEKDLANTLWRRLTNKNKILIILDDVWEWEKCNFKEIGIPIDGSKHKNCYVLLTTQDLEVCNKMECQLIIKLEVLSKNEAWILFQNYAKIDQNSSKTLKNKGRQIAKLCKGLPLAIEAIASILKNGMLALRSLNKTFCIRDEILDRVYKPLEVSYNYLHSEAKELFKLCSMFPKDYEILVEDITTFAIGLRLCGEVSSYGDGRNVVGKSLKKLINSCLLSRANEGEFVKMHDLVRDVAHWIAKKVIQVVTEPRSLKALQEDASVKSALKQLHYRSMNDLPKQLDCPKIEILILEWDSHLEFVIIPDTFFEGMRSLNVCVLKGCGYQQTIVLPKSIESLNNLITLSLSAFILHNLYVLENLQNLESLELKFCLFNKLPDKVVKLEKLKMLRLTNCKIRKNPFEVISKLSLEELYFVGNNWSYLEVGIKDATILSLQRYHIELEKENSLRGSINDSISRALSIDCFDDSPSIATMKKVVQQAEVLHLYKLQGGWTTIIPHFVGVIGEMKDLIELKLICCSKIKFLIDAKGLSFSQETLFSNIAKLSLENMGNLEQLCHDSPPPNLFENLQELLIEECLQLNLRLFHGNLNLWRLKILRVMECPKLTSLFKLSTARSLDLLEELTIKRSHGLKHIITYEKEGGSHMNYGSIFPKLKLLFVEDCNQLIYMIGEYHHEIHLSALDVFLALQELHLSYMPNIKTICQNNDQPMWLALRKLELIECPQFIITAISDFMVYSYESHLNQLPPNEGLGTNMKQVHTLDDLKVINSKIEGIICLEGKSDSQQEVSLGINSLYLHNVPDLSYTFSGPKRMLSLPNLRALEFEGCGKLKFIFSTTVLRSLPLLGTLYIVDCEALEQIVEDDYENQNNFHQVFFPKLRFIYVINCRKLKRLFWMNTPYEFPNLWELFILEASNLEEVFGSSKMGETEKQVVNVLSGLTYLVLAELPSLANFCQWTKFNVYERSRHTSVFVINCPKLSLTSIVTTVTLQDTINVYERSRHHSVVHGEDHRWGQLWMINLVLNELNCLKNPKQEKLSIKETENNIVGEVSPPEIPTYLSEATLLGHQEAVGEPKEFEGKESMGAPISTEEGALDKTALTIPEPKDSSLTPIDTSPEETSPLNNKEKMEESVQELMNPSAAPLVTFKQKGFVEKGSNEPVSGDALEENISANESGQRHETSLDLGPMRVSKTETSLDKDTNASSSNLQDLMHGIFSTLNSVEKDGEVQEAMSSISVIPSDRFNLVDQQLLIKAFADLEAYLMMPLKDFANSEVNSHCLENSLKFLSSWFCGNGVPLEGLKAKIDSLLQNMPRILSSFKQASDTIDKFTVLDKRQKSIKEELPRRKEAASTLEKSIAEAQRKEVALRDKFYRLQAELKSTENEIKEHEVHLSSLKEQGKKLNAETIDFLKEFEAVKKDKSERVEDSRKAQQELFQASYEWLDLCNQLMQSCNVARNLF